ncbi:hypothetical protein [Actinomadura graeca]|uniref:hypothetical protein n=1 Tax=Actinomadura graeca TaxID=2750812 RepID=UPI001E5794D8|nr:hypothetical protein [Actinomadura graeca]
MFTTTPGPDEAMAKAGRGLLFADRDFRLVFAAAAAGKLGFQIGDLAIPLLAVTELDASPGQVGALSALSMVAYLLVGLPAGVWVDRTRRRVVQVVAACCARAWLPPSPSRSGWTR